MYVRDALISNPVTVSPDEPFAELVAKILASPQAKAAVLDSVGRVVGVVGVHDVLRKIVPHYLDLDEKLMEVMHEGYAEERLLRLTDLTAKDLMTDDVDCVTPDDTLIKAVSLIVEKRRKSLPVIDDKRRFLGMVTRRSILQRVVSSSGLHDNDSDE